MASSAAANPRAFSAVPDPNTPKRCLVIRWGAVGDAIQASSLFPQLKEDGWQVWVDVNEMGEQVLRHDPHLSGIMVTPLGRIPEGKLTEHVTHRALGFQRLIMLNDMTEGALIKQPDRVDYYWPDAVRRRECGFNYVEYLHRVADVSYAKGCQQRFYSTPTERAQAQAFCGPRRPVIVWAIAGSHQHKVWPGLPRAMARVLHETDAHIVVTGGPETKPLWDSTLAFILDYHRDVDRRMTALIGSHPIRQIMSLAQAADVVVGPETGLLNAMAMEPNGKVLLLSHSSKENLTRDWLNTTTIEPDGSVAPCWPCHRMHPSTVNCPQHELTRLALCMSSITVDRVVDAIKDAIGRQAVAAVRPPESTPRSDFYKAMETAVPASPGPVSVNQVRAAEDAVVVHAPIVPPLSAKSTRVRAAATRRRARKRPKE